MADYDLLIVGGGPAALSCAITARKRALKCVMVSAPSGVSWLRRAERVDNYPGLPAVSGPELLSLFTKQAADLGAELRQGQVRLIQPMGGEYMALVGNDILTARAVALAMGAARPSLLPGEEQLLGQGVSWCGTCDGMFYRGREVAVLSAWNGGAEEAAFLASLCSRVDYYTLAPHDLPSDARITMRDGRPKGMSRQDGKILLETSAGSQSYDGVFIFRPSVAPDRLISGLTFDGPFITTDRRMRTGLPHVYACGDCTGQPLQIAKAVGEGNVAAVTAAEELAK